MVRIVGEEPQEDEPAALDDTHRSLFKALGWLVSEQPKQVYQLLRAHGTQMPDKMTRSVLSEHLLDALAEGDAGFNHRLALLMLDGCLDDRFDTFDFEKIKSKAGAVLSSGADGLKNRGLVGGISAMVGSAGSMIGKKGGQRDQASADLQEGLTTPKPAAMPANKKKLLLAIAIAGICLFGLVAMMNHNKGPVQKTLTPITT